MKLGKYKVSSHQHCAYHILLHRVTGFRCLDPLVPDDGRGAARILKMISDCQCDLSPDGLIDPDLGKAEVAASYVEAGSFA
eukprot:8770023-Karenia_brevis.AAC.1